MKGQGLLEGGTMSEGPQDEGKQLGLGHNTPAAHGRKHRDTLFCSFNSGKVVTFFYILIFFSACVDVVEALAA